MKKTLYYALISVLAFSLLILAGCTQQMSFQKPQNPTLKIGVVTDLTGPASYWGQSTVIGITKAIEELKKENISVEIIYEDYALDASKATTATQKLVTIDNVDAIYSEFNPGAIAVASVIQSAPIPHVYDAAIESPLKTSNLTYKTYLDYKEGCKMIAKEFQNAGLKNIGMLQIQLEAGVLCTEGVKEVYPQVSVEKYDFGETNVQTQLLKMKDSQAIINVGFEGDTLHALQQMNELHITAKYGTVGDTMTPTVLQDVESYDVLAFDFPKTTEVFEGSLSQTASALGYMHIKQMAYALKNCETITQDCLNDQLVEAMLGFSGFNNHIAQLGIQLYTFEK